MVKAHGISGEVVVLPETDYEGRFAQGRPVYTRSGLSLHVRSNKPGATGWLVSFLEIADRDGAEDLVGEELIVSSSDRRSLGADEFWPDQLVGLLVRDRSGLEVGRVRDVDDSTPQARLVIATASGDVEVPFVDDLVPEINLDDGYLVVAPIPGLFD